MYRMPKVKKPKTKQKQKQRQSQRVVVNINTGRKTSTRKPASRRGGSGGNFVSYPVYTNAPSDYAPIIHNLPAQYQNQPAITMPRQALENVHIPPTITYPTPTTLQTNTANDRPLRERSGGISIAELKNVLNTPSKGLKSTDSRQTKSLQGEFFAPPTRTLSSYPSSISIMSDITTPNELIGNIPRARNQDLTGMTPQQKYQRQQEQTAELNKSKKIAKAQQTFKL